MLPVNRQRAIEFIQREVEAARSDGLNARLLALLTRHHDSAALQSELELARLDPLDQFLVCPPVVESLGVAEAKPAA